MNQNCDPKYDTDQITFGYLKKVLGDEALKNINSKNNINICKNYGSTPIPPYHIGDTWTTKNKVYKCVTDRLLGNFNINDWAEIYNKETMEAINSNLQFLSSVELIPNSDNKIETFYLENDPSANWLSDNEKQKHIGDYYQNSNDYKTYIYCYENGQFFFKEIEVPTLIFEPSTTHRNIFLKRPNEYNENDLWKINNVDDKELFKNANIGDFFKCIKGNILFQETDWKKVENELSIKANLYSSAGFRISSNDILSNIQYCSTGLYNGYDLLGFNKYFTVNGTVKNYSDIAVDIDLPDNFKIVSAYLSLYHTPVYWNYFDENLNAIKENYGYSRNLKLYKIKNENNFKLFMAFANEYRYEFNKSDLEEIVNAFKSTNYTPENHTGTTIIRKDTINLKSFLNEHGKTKLIVRSSNNLPSTDKEVTEQTGMARVIVNILGYIDIKEE